MLCFSREGLAVPEDNFDWDGLFASSRQGPGILSYSVLWCTGKSSTHKNFLVPSVSGAEFAAHCSDVLKKDASMLSYLGLSGPSMSLL